MPERPRPLPPAILALIAVAAETGTTRSVPLADRLGVSVHTVRTTFKRGFAAAGVRSRSELLMLAWREGWLGDPHRGGLKRQM